MTDAEIGWFLVAFTVFTAVLWVGSLRLSRVREHGFYGINVCRSGHSRYGLHANDHLALTPIILSCHSATQ
jgi:hypothetical protein